MRRGQERQLGAREGSGFRGRHLSGESAQFVGLSGRREVGVSVVLVGAGAPEGISVEVTRLLGHFEQ